MEEQQAQVSKFVSSMCTVRTPTPWCLVDDSVSPFWYNTETGEMQFSKPAIVKTIPVAGHVQPTDPSIFSYFTHTSVVTGEVIREYIEPLVGHLRHPLSGCTPSSAVGHLITDRSYIVPPTRVGKGRKYYFDAGASSWSSGKGGPSLSYFTTVWGRHGVDFDVIECWEGGTEVKDFYCDVPGEYLWRTHFHHGWIASSVGNSSNVNPFVPSIIRETVDREDYVLFKLDIDNGPVEKGTIEHLLEDGNEDIEFIDEIVWEQHVDNYIMNPWWGETIDEGMTIADSYQYFLKLRMKGVRAHSWV